MEQFSVVLLLTVVGFSRKTYWAVGRGREESRVPSGISGAVIERCVGAGENGLGR